MKVKYVLSIGQLLFIMNFNKTRITVSSAQTSPLSIFREYFWIHRHNPYFKDFFVDMTGP